jgi:hypothetical protein
MELTLQWFWLAKLAFSAAFLLALYKAWRTSQASFEAGDNKLWNKWTTVSLVILVLQIISPVKMDVNTKAKTDYANTQIEQSKVLPAKTIDNSFDKSVNKDFGISAEDLK